MTVSFDLEWLSSGISFQICYSPYMKDTLGATLSDHR
jgi:hypothetical protein